MKSLILSLLLTAAAHADRSVTLAWDANAPADQVTGYEVQVDGKTIQQVEGTTAQVTIPDTKCVVSVVAVNIAGKSEPASLSVPPTPANPKGLRITAILRTTVSTPAP